MLGFGGRYYWGRKEVGERRGIVVVFAWMCSEEKHVMNYVELYSSLGWDSLVCHAGCFNMFVPPQATALAFDILKELDKEIKIRPCPIVFSSFSGGPKACMYKLLQIIEGKHEVQPSQDDYQLVRNCVSGFIYDSSPVDFYRDLALEFFLHPSVLKRPHPPKLLSWTAKGITFGLDALFLSKFETQRADYWRTLYASVSLGAPYLILCSENDDLAPFETLRNFAQRLQELGGDVKLVKFDGSPHVGHYRIYPTDYKAAVSKLLEKASLVYSQRIQRLDGDKMNSGTMHQEDFSRLIYNERKAAASSIESIQGLAPEPCDQFLSGLVEHQQEEGFIHLFGPPSVHSYGVLDDVNFDERVPKNVEEWDILQSGSLTSALSASAEKNSSSFLIKGILRSKL